MHLQRLLKTASFKLTALYVLLFGLSVAALATVFYFNAVRVLDAQERARIQSEASMLRGEYERGGLPALLSGIRERQRGRIAGGLDYTVYRGDGTRLFGNLPKVPFEKGWKHTSGPPDGDEPPGQLEQLLVYRLPLSNGLWLMVGDDIGHIRELGHVIEDMSIWGLLLAVTLGVIGGAALSLAFLRRIDSITRTAEAIIAGDMARRIPLRGADDDIDRLATTLNRMLDRIGSLVESVRHVSNDIAHDLRTPLARLRQVLEDGRRSARTPAEYEATTERAIREIDSILETFSAILRIAQIEAGTRRSGFRRLDLSGLAESLVHSFAPVAEDGGKSLSASIAPGLVLEGDAELLTQMMVNLIENAIRHSRDGAAIVIGLRNGPAGAEFSVADDGPGIPAGERERIFRRFYRLERSRSTAGSGLGLSLVAAIANLHDAKIIVSDNHPGLKIVIVFSQAKSETARERPLSRAAE